MAPSKLLRQLASVYSGHASRGCFASNERRGRNALQHSEIVENRSRTKAFTISATSIIAIAIAAGPVAAQTASSSIEGGPSTPSPSIPSQASATTQGVQDIIVTAERRSSSTQKTPLTIQVLTPLAIAKAGITSPAQLTSVLPGVQIGTSGPATSVYIRGVGGFQSTVVSSPAVPYYIDDVYVARTQSVVSELYDIDRVEVVKGPQGTLYGRNASGGAINILTRNPTLNEFEARGTIELGDYADQSAEIAVNVPVSPTVAIRASGTIVDKGGYTSEGFGQDKHYAGRLKALWKPSSRFSILLNGSYGRIYGGSSAVVALNRDIPGWYPWLDVTDPHAQAYAYQTGVAPAPFLRATQPSDARQDLHFYNVSAKLNWDLGFANLTIIPAYRHSQMQYAGLFGFLLDNGYSLGSFPERPLLSRAASVEARLSGDLGRLKYVFGLYFDNEDQNEQFTIDGGYLQSVGEVTVAGTRSYATFGQATYSLLDHVRLIGGLRYTADRRALNGQTYLVSPVAFLGAPPQQGVACAFPAPTQPQCLVDSFSGRKTFHNVSFKAGAEADVLRNSLLYATVSRGFKAGGFNEQSAVGTPGSALPFQPETLTSYDVGLKNRFLDNRLQVNISGFYWDYKNHQEPVLTYTNVPGVTNLVNLNAGASQIYGGTFDIVTRPWTGGTISTSVEYAHSRYKTFTKTIPTFSYNPAATGCRVSAEDPQNTVLDCSGFEVSRVPKWSGNLDLSQEIGLARGKLVPEALLSFASPRWLGTDFIPVERVKAYGKLDLSLTYQAPRNRWSLTGFVRNVTNAAVYTEAAKDPFSALVYANIQPPRTYGATLSFDF